MKKQEFMQELERKLSGLPKKELCEQLGFFSEMIDDKIEDGCREEEAVESFGTVDEVADQIVAEIPLTKILKEKAKRSGRNPWATAMLILGSPVWFSLLISLFAVFFSLVVALWSVIVSLWAVFVSLVAGGLGGVLVGVFTALVTKPLTGGALTMAGFVSAGLSIFGFHAFLAATRGAAWLTKKIFLLIKLCFVGKENA